MPAVLKALSAFFITVSDADLNSVSIPPIDCSSAAPSFMDFVIPATTAVPIAAAPMMFLKEPANLPPADSPAVSPAASSSFCIPLFIPFAEGIICTYAFASVVPISPSVSFFQEFFRSIVRPYRTFLFLTAAEYAINYRFRRIGSAK